MFAAQGGTDNQRRALDFIERNLHRLVAYVRAKQRERVGEGSAVLKVRQRNKVLWIQLGGHAQAAIRGESNVKDAGNAVERNAIDNDSARRVDHCDL